MTELLERFEHQLEEITGLPVEHLKVGKDVTPPYLCWYVSRDRNLYADNLLYVELGYTVIVEVYTRKDRAGLLSMEALRKAGFYCKLRDDNWLPDENLWATIIEVEVCPQK